MLRKVKWKTINSVVDRNVMFVLLRTKYDEICFQGHLTEFSVNTQQIIVGRLSEFVN